MKLRGKYRVPEGVYVAEFVEAKDIETEAYGAGVAWEFVVVDGPLTGKSVSRVTGPEPTKKNACGKMVAALSGAKRYDPSIEVETDDYIGRRYHVEVEETESGATRVEDLTLLPDAVPEPPKRPKKADNVRVVGVGHGRTETVAFGSGEVEAPADELPF